MFSRFPFGQGSRGPGLLLFCKFDSLCTRTATVPFHNATPCWIPAVGSTVLPGPLHVQPGTLYHIVCQRDNKTRACNLWQNALTKHKGLPTLCHRLEIRAPLRRMDLGRHGWHPRWTELPPSNNLALALANAITKFFLFLKKKNPAPPPPPRPRWMEDSRTRVHTPFFALTGARHHQVNVTHCSPLDGTPPPPHGVAGGSLLQLIRQRHHQDYVTAPR